MIGTTLGSGVKSRNQLIQHKDQSYVDGLHLNETLKFCLTITKLNGYLANKNIPGIGGK